MGRMLKTFSSPWGRKPFRTGVSCHYSIDQLHSKQLWECGHRWPDCPRLLRVPASKGEALAAPGISRAYSEGIDATGWCEQHLFVSSLPGLPTFASGIFFIIWFLRFWAFQSPLRIRKLWTSLLENAHLYSTQGQDPGLQPWLWPGLVQEKMEGSACSELGNGFLLFYALWNMVSQSNALWEFLPSVSCFLAWFSILVVKLQNTELILGLPTKAVKTL